MNFFGLLPKTTRSVRKDVMPEKTAKEEHEHLRTRYVRYCTGKFVNAEKAALDFDLICRMPEVACVGFHQNGAFLIGTTMVVLEDAQGTLREIGEFIIAMDRHEKQIYFENITRSVPSQSRNFSTYHPHVHAGNGTICMPNGGDTMLTALGAGRLLRATRYAIAGLYTYTNGARGIPYSKLEAWPERK